MPPALVAAIILVHTGHTAVLLWGARIMLRLGLGLDDGFGRLLCYSWDGDWVGKVWVNAVLFGGLHYRGMY